MAEAERMIDHVGSEAVYDFYCELCNEDGLHIEAEGFCNDCCEYLCRKCIVYHKKTRLTRNHKVLSKENMPTETTPSTDRVRTDISSMCHQHKGETVKYYCKSHDTLGCNTCFISRHRHCADIDTIIEVSEGIFDSNEYKNMQQNLKFLHQEIRDMVKKSRDHLNTSEDYFFKAFGELTRFREEINSLIDKLEASLKAEIEQYKAEIKEKGESMVRTCNAFRETIDKLTSEFESLNLSNRVCQTYIRMKETMADVKDIERQLRHVREDNTVKSFTFVPDDDLRKLLTRSEGLGQLCIQYSVDQNTTPVLQDVRSVSFVEDTTPVKQAVSSASFVQDINVRSKSDKTYCYITGSAVITDSKLVIVDNYNCMVKLVDTNSMKVISELQVSPYTWDVAVINKDHAAVTNYNTNEILILKVTDSIEKERDISVNGECMGIAYSKNQLVVTYETPPKLEIMDQQGNVISMIEDDRDGNKLFRCPYYVCVSSDGDTLYVSDWSIHRVVSLSREFTVKSIYSDSMLKNPSKVCLDHRGNVLVCGWNSRNLDMLTPGCTKIKTILTKADGLTYKVYSVSQCRRTDRLYIGSQHCDTVKVFQLS